MTTRKYSTTWKGIPAVDELGVDLENLREPLLLFEGPARECMKKYPQSINIGAALSIAGIGFDRTIIKIYADPTVEYNTHEIRWEGATGKVTVSLREHAGSREPEDHIPGLSQHSLRAEEHDGEQDHRRLIPAESRETAEKRAARAYSSGPLFSLPEQFVQPVEGHRPREGGVVELAVGVGAALPFENMKGRIRSR